MKTLVILCTSMMQEKDGIKHQHSTLTVHIEDTLKEWQSLVDRCNIEVAKEYNVKPEDMVFTSFNVLKEFEKEIV